MLTALSVQERFGVRLLQCRVLGRACGPCRVSVLVPLTALPWQAPTRSIVLYWECWRLVAVARRPQNHELARAREGWSERGVHARNMCGSQQGADANRPFFLSASMTLEWYFSRFTARNLRLIFDLSDFAMATGRPAGEVKLKANTIES